MHAHAHTPFNKRCTMMTQRGIILPITLISLLILLIASVALIRSTDTSLLIAGQLGFKRDVLNQAERAIPEIKKIFDTGDLKTAALREQNLISSNYYATIQTSNSSGIPTELLGNSFGTSNAIKDDAAKITVRYLIDRMCLNTGPVTTNHCSTATSSSDVGGDAMSVGNEGKASGVETPVYRISIRVTGPRNTEAFLQSTFTR